jgi:hypothetical protein
MKSTLGGISLGMFLLCFQNNLQGASQTYRELLPRIAETAELGKGPDIRITMNDLLRTSQRELDSCISMANVNTKTYVSGTNSVQACSQSIVLRVRKDAAGPADVFPETSGTDKNLIGSCLQKALRSILAADVLQGEALDGRVIADVDCSLDVDRHRFSLDEIDYRCRANWQYFRTDEAYSEKSTRTWK